VGDGGLAVVIQTTHVSHSPTLTLVLFPTRPPNQHQGRYFKLAGECTVKDTNGGDGRLLMRSAAKQTTCFTACAIAEAGQSGQPAFSKSATNEMFVRAVLSQGPPTGTCKGYGGWGCGG